MFVGGMQGECKNNVVPFTRGGGREEERARSKRTFPAAGPGGARAALRAADGWQGPRCRLPHGAHAALLVAARPAQISPVGSHTSVSRENAARGASKRRLERRQEKCDQRVVPGGLAPHERSPR